MTLITTHISKFGIIHAADSNLSTPDANAGTGQKLFQIPNLNAALTVAGAYSVGGQDMDVWLNAFIAGAISDKNVSLGAFSRLLGQRLQAEMTPSEKADFSMMHIAGYVEVNGKSHPEFWFVRNITGINKLGDYEGPTDDFSVDEQFWWRDFKNVDFDALANGWTYFYFNGYPPGRIAYSELRNDLDSFFKKTWGNPKWKFRPAKSLEEMEIIATLQLQIISSLFLLSDYPAQYIGGPPQVYTISQPSNMVTRWEDYDH